MRGPRIILVWSIQQTGTWFTIELLKLHPKIGFFSELVDLFGPQRVDAGCDLLTTGKELSNAIDSVATLDEVKELNEKMKRAIAAREAPVSLDRDRSLLLHAHLFHPVKKTYRQSPQFFSGVLSHALAAYYDTIVPLRDPLMSLITRQSRHPDLDHSFIIDSFVHLTTIPYPLFFFPIDRDPADRGELVDRMLRGVGLGWTPEIEQYVSAWAPVNTSGEYPLKAAYRAGDIQTIRNAIPEEFDLLRSKEDVLRPFLRSHGYRKLAWYS